VLNRTGDKMALPAIPARVVRASVPGGGAKVEQPARGIELTVPPTARNDMDAVVALQLYPPAKAIARVR
jgi:alpha-L-fucosidase